MRVFVKNIRGEALMPCSQRKARLLLKEDKARIIGYKPFAIQLTVPTLLLRVKTKYWQKEKLN